MNKILVALLALLILPVAFLVPAFADNDAVCVLGEIPSGASAVRRDFDILYSDSLTGSYTWQAASNGSVAVNPLDSSSRYIYYFGLSSGYVSGIRIYFTILGEFNNLDLFFNDIYISTLGLEGDYPLTSYDFRIAYYNAALAQYDYQTFNGGVYTYDETEEPLPTPTIDPDSYGPFPTQGPYYPYAPTTYGYYFQLNNMPSSTYFNNATEYYYNGFVEFRFVPVDHFGYSNAEGGYNGNFNFRFSQSYDGSVNSVDIAFFVDRILNDRSSDLHYYIDPVLPVFDFVNGTVITSLLGNNLSAVLNPFVGVFIGNNVNQTFRYLATFCFGMFVLSVLISYLRRAKK